jgi:hypothetical protein
MKRNKNYAKKLNRNSDQKKEKLCKKIKYKSDKKLISLNQYLLLVIKLFFWFIFV